MESFFQRQSARYRNQLNQSSAELLGLAEGLISDHVLADTEVQFLDQWLKHHDAIAHTWPGDVLHQRVQHVLADGKVTEEERAHLIATLRQLIGGSLERLAESPKVTTLAIDEIDAVQFSDAWFCLTGEFVFAPKQKCAEAIAARGGVVKSSVSKRLNYLVIGGLGSDEWKHGSFGTKIEKAIALKRQGASILIIHEDQWASAL